MTPFASHYINPPKTLPPTATVPVPDATASSFGRLAQTPTLSSNQTPIMRTEPLPLRHVSVFHLSLVCHGDLQLVLVASDYTRTRYTTYGLCPLP